MASYYGITHYEGDADDYGDDADDEDEDLIKLPVTCVPNSCCRWLIRLLNILITAFLYFPIVQGEGDGMMSCHVE